ncbi:unnamed protein product [Kuraishia capsulata CBS 1993]|uniref:Uncharacterized protein n=1 Tax=Kuraishia capsulata CBS 1993 TaxID=1382522 RepID=W6MSC1_9ASCO|nr:uncharacterized protein KUCA_T00005592001 [Kuraishia capsulata CBS 1993]CDK29599.1 unnamed protein product [Kuraishia capsulata CBS 1993]
MTTASLLSDYLLSRSSLEHAVPMKRFRAIVSQSQKGVTPELEDTLYKTLRRQHESRLKDVADSIRHELHEIDSDDGAEAQVSTEEETLEKLVRQMKVLDSSLDSMVDNLEIEIAQRLVDMRGIVDSLDSLETEPDEDMNATVREITGNMKEMESEIMAALE